MDDPRAPAGSSDDVSARAAVDGVRALVTRLGMPSTLGKAGLTEEMVPSLVQGALDDVVLANNPVQPGPVQLTALVQSLL